MDLNPIAQKLAAYGREEAAALAMIERTTKRLRAIHEDRCAFLQSLTKMPLPAGMQPLSDATIALAVAPKDPQ